MSPRPNQEVDALVESILTRDEFKELAKETPPAEHLIGEIVESVLRAVQSLVGDLRANHPGIYVAILVVGLALIAFSVWVGARGAARRRHGEATVRNVLPELLRGDPANLRREAEDAARRGAYLDAVRLLFRATIIDRALREGSLQKLRDAETFRRARTYREIVDEFARDEQQAHRLKDVATRIELGLYGGVQLGVGDWEDARALARDLS